MRNRPEELIRVSEFRHLLENISRGKGFPRKRRQQHVLLKSVVLLLEPGQDYPERQINDTLQKWLDTVGKSIEIDHVSLRRHLVDEGYLIRDRAGRRYRVDEGKADNIFEPAINALNPVAVIEEAEQRRALRKRAFLG